MDNVYLARFVVEARNEGTIVLDRMGSRPSGTEIIVITEPLLDAALRVASVVNWRDSDAWVEVYSSGVGLAMAGLLRAYGVKVIQEHVWTVEEDDEDE